MPLFQDHISLFSMCRLIEPERFRHIVHFHDREKQFITGRAMLLIILYISVICVASFFDEWYILCI